MFRDLFTSVFFELYYGVCCSLFVVCVCLRFCLFDVWCLFCFVRAASFVVAVFLCSLLPFVFGFVSLCLLFGGFRVCLLVV